MHCVTDSSTWINLKNAGLLKEALRLPFVWLIPDVILEEELDDPSGKWLEEQGVQRCELSGPQVELVAEMAVRYLRPSRNDLFALVQAKEEGSLLLTDDGPLRKAACAEGVQVHGTLWVLDQLLSQALINKRTAAERLRRMIKAGARFPAEEVARRLLRWEGERDGPEPESA